MECHANRDFTHSALEGMCETIVRAQVNQILDIAPHARAKRFGVCDFQRLTAVTALFRFEDERGPVDLPVSVGAVGRRNDVNGSDVPQPRCSERYHRSSVAVR